MQASLRTKLKTAVLAVFAVLAAGAASAQEAAAAPAVDAPAVKPRRAVDAAWWNQPKKIAMLSLTEEQRAELDTLAESYLEEHTKDSSARDAYAAMGEALASGDWEGARRHSKEAAAAVARSAEGQAELMIEGVKVLSVEQRKALYAKFPGMLQRSWIGRGGWRAAAARK